MTLNDLCTVLLPPSAPLQLQTIHATEHDLTLEEAATAPTACCPDCVHPALRIHSRSWRTLADLPWSTTPVQLHLRVRRFFCDTPTCPRQTFTERLPQVAPHYARTTTRLRETQTQTGLALGGAAGARHLARQPQYAPTPRPAPARARG